MDLTEQLNRRVPPTFQYYQRAIPKTVPALTNDKRILAGGNMVLGERLFALTPDTQGNVDEVGVNGWGAYFDLADLCTAFEDLFKLQPDSGFLRGIRGIVEKDGQTYVAVDVDAVKSAIQKGTENYFEKQFSRLETAHYQTREGEARQAQVQQVVLFPYDERQISFNDDQFGAIDAKAMRRDSVVNGRDMEPAEIVQGDKVIHPAWGIYDQKIIVPLVEKQRKFRFQGQDYEFKKLMGFYLPSQPSGNLAEGRALCVFRLGGRSGLFGDFDLGVGDARVVGVAEKYAGGVAKK